MLGSLQMVFGHFWPLSLPQMSIPAMVKQCFLTQLNKTRVSLLSLPRLLLLLLLQMSFDAMIAQCLFATQLNKTRDSLLTKHRLLLLLLRMCCCR
jgi:hypothetical protein